MNPVKQAVKRALFACGFELRRTSVNGTPLAVELRRRALMERHGVDCVVDVGANRGQYASALRRAGYRGPIFSFEPLRGAFASLARRAHRDPAWRAFPLAAGAGEGHAEINVSANSYSSSLLPMAERHRQSDPSSCYVATEPVAVTTLDRAALPLFAPGARVLLKIDAQGYEAQVIEGAEALLDHVRIVECELSLAPLYDGAAPFSAMLELLARRGFTPAHFEPGFSERETGCCLQIDGFFIRQ
jgi:FkbM family methyltransferase